MYAASWRCLLTYLLKGFIKKASLRPRTLQGAVTVYADYCAVVAARHEGMDGTTDRAATYILVHTKRFYPMQHVVGGSCHTCERSPPSTLWMKSFFACLLGESLRKSRV